MYRQQEYAVVDVNRFRCRIGLIVPDAGYPFSRIPDWLIRQRLPKGGYTPPTGK
jgi:hypothetical protein